MRLSKLHKSWVSPRHSFQRNLHRQIETDAHHTNFTWFLSVPQILAYMPITGCVKPFNFFFPRKEGFSWPILNWAMSPHASCNSHYPIISIILMALTQNIQNWSVCLLPGKWVSITVLPIYLHVGGGNPLCPKPQDFIACFHDRWWFIWARVSCMFLRISMGSWQQNCTYPSWITTVHTEKNEQNAQV